MLSSGSVPNSSATGALSAGSYSFQATYSGDGNYGTATGPCESFTIVKALTGTTTTLVSSANPSTTGQHVTFTATVSPRPDGGAVEFLDGGRAIPGCGAVSLSPSAGKATCVTAYGKPGQNEIKAAYSGDAPFTASQSSTVRQIVRSSLTLRGRPSGRSGEVRVTLTCARQSGGCHVAATITTSETIRGHTILAVTASAGHKRRTVGVGSKTETLAAGRTAMLTIRLNTTGRKLLVHFKRLPVKLTLTLVADGERTTVAAKEVKVRGRIQLGRRVE
jgi:hypothetical protein